jgi:hypothetical protein
MIRNLCRTYPTFPTPLGSHYRLPLTVDEIKKEKMPIQFKLPTKVRLLGFYDTVPYFRDFTVPYHMVSISARVANKRSEKIPRNRLWTVFVIPRKKVLLSRNSICLGIAHSQARNGTNGRGFHETMRFDGTGNTATKKSIAESNIGHIITFKLI